MRETDRLGRRRGDSARNRGGADAGGRRGRSRGGRHELEHSRVVYEYPDGEVHIRYLVQARVDRASIRRDMGPVSRWWEDSDRDVQIRSVC